jgi:hypothetical protein
MLKIRSQELRRTVIDIAEWRSKPVSIRRLWKTGIFQGMAGDFRHFQPPAPEIGSLETACRIAKARHWRAFLR